MHGAAAATHLHIAVQCTSASKHSQYFFRHRDLRHRHPFLWTASPPRDPTCGGREGGGGEGRVQVQPQGGLAENRYTSIVERCSCDGGGVRVQRGGRQHEQRLLGGALGPSSDRALMHALPASSAQRAAGLTFGAKARGLLCRILALSACTRPMLCVVLRQSRQAHPPQYTPGRGTGVRWQAAVAHGAWRRQPGREGGREDGQGEWG